MKRFDIINLLFIAFFSPITVIYPNIGIKNSAFGPGEALIYDVHYGFISAGTATMAIDKTIHKINGNPCYKIEVHGTTSPALAVFGLKVNNTYGTYLDTHSLLPHRFYRNAHENNYMFKEVIHFNHQKRLATIEELDNINGTVKYKKKFTIPNNVQDLVSGYYALRELDTNQLQIKEKVHLNVFFEGITYNNLEIIFLGKQMVTTPLGTFKTLVFTPVLPNKSTIFAEENAVEIFISDDENKIPLKLKINLTIGEIEMNLKEYKGLKNVL